jgi:hypothetical protein
MVRGESEEPRCEWSTRLELAAMLEGGDKHLLRRVVS